MMDMNESKEKANCCNELWRVQQKATQSGNVPVSLPSFYQRIGGITMKKGVNSIMLGVLIGFAVSYLPPEAQVFVIVPVAGMLWDRWDEFSLKWGGQA